MKPDIVPKQREIELGENDLIVSKTDLQGRLTYANRKFMRIADHSERDLIGVHHNILLPPGHAARLHLRALTFWRSLSFRKMGVKISGPSIPIYGYCAGVFSSRKLERATCDPVAFRCLAAGLPRITTHWPRSVAGFPARSLSCSFRCPNWRGK